MEIILLILLFLIGISVGSFLNVVADRVPCRQSIVSPPSHCFNCGHVLAWKDMVPVVSYIALKGRCRYCSAFIGPRSAIIELITGLFFILAWFRFGASIQISIVLIYTAIFIILSITDLEGREMPVVFVYSAIIIIILLVLARPFTRTGPDLIEAIAGFAAGFVLMALIWMLSKWTGKYIASFGNVWVAGLIGSSTGFPLIIAVLAFAILISAIYLSVLLLNKASRPIRLPITAILCFSALVIIYAGELYIKTIWPFNIM